MREKPPLLAEVLPDRATKLRLLLVEQGHRDLAQAVETLRIYSSCACGSDGCAAFDTVWHPRRHRAEALMVVGRSSTEFILNVEDEEILSIEFPNDPEAHAALVQSLNV